VLADRIAAALIHHEPGWRLPRLTALARRYNVSAAEAGAAIEELTARHLVRRLPDGQVYRASPAEYQIPLEGLAGLSSRADPMGGQLTCRNRQVSTRRVPEDTGQALGLAAGEIVLLIKCWWLVGGEPGALSATYLPQRLASLAGDFGGAPLPEPGSARARQAGTRAVAGPGDPGSGGHSLAGQPEDEQASGEQAAREQAAREQAESGQAPAAPGAWPAGEQPPASPARQLRGGLPRAVQVEFGPPPPSVARSLRLAAGQPAAIVTVRFDDSSAGRPAALTVTTLRPDLFRIVIQAPGGQPPASGDGLASAWTDVAEGWEP
jgi:DNA-binding GntR family transcriptional regulator